MLNSRSQARGYSDDRDYNGRRDDRDYRDRDYNGRRDDRPTPATHAILKVLKAGELQTLH